MTKPGFVDKRIEYFIHEELKKFDSLMQRNAFLEGVKFMRENIDAFIEQPTPTVGGKQTATEWLFEQLWEAQKDKFTWNSILIKAKAMEKEQIEEAFKHGGLPTFLSNPLTSKQYYQQTYKEDKQ